MIPAVLVYLLAVVAFLRGRQQDPLRRATRQLTINTMALMGFCLLLWVSLPPTVSMQEFPAAELAGNQQLMLNYLQRLNATAVRTSQVVFWFILLFLLLFLQSLLIFFRALSHVTQDLQDRVTDRR